jgi:hypothetical protein
MHRLVPDTFLLAGEIKRIPKLEKLAQALP